MISSAGPFDRVRGSPRGSHVVPHHLPHGFPIPSTASLTAVGPAQGQARQIVIAEQQAAARIASIQTALDATRLGHHSVRGDQRAGLAAELHQLRAHHPTLAPGDPAARWETLIADAKTVDRDALAQLRSHHAQAITDLDWYRNTATQLRADADHQQATITGIRDELTTRTGHSPSPASPASTRIQGRGGLRARRQRLGGTPQPDRYRPQTASRLSRAIKRLPGPRLTRT